MGFQFLHVESYARHAGKGKAGGHTVASVMAEATRQPDACPHVEKPSPPVLLFGRPLAEVEAEATEWAANAVDSIGRKLRKDGLCLLGGVISAPDDMADKDWEAMKQDAIAWLNRDGRLVSVAEHTDEAHRHVHFYKVPAPGERFETLHPGRAAALAAKAGGAVKGEQNRAYKEAMRGFQDDFFEDVGAKHGLTRLGPAKRRLTRSAWKAERVAALSMSRTMMKAEQMMEVAAHATNDAAAAHAAADKAKAEAVEAHTAAIELAAVAKADADKAEKVNEANAKAVAKWRRQKEAMDVVAQRIGDERADIERWKNRGGRVGAFVGNFAGRAVDAVMGVLTDRKGKEAARSAALGMAQKAAKAAKTVAESEKEAAKRAKLAKEAIEETSRKDLRAVEAERDAAQAELARLAPPAPNPRQEPTMRR